MTAILLVDTLGLKALWRSGGVKAVQKRLAVFRARLAQALKATTPASLIEGGIESDAFALRFSAVEDAVRVGIYLYRSAFVAKVGRRADNERFWFRGVIVDGPPDGEPLIRTSHLQGQPNVSFVRQSSALAHAIADEQSGFRGMRLLIDKQLATSELARVFEMTIGDRLLHRVRRLIHSRYPDERERDERFKEVLWMVPDDLAQWPGLMEQMTRRLRHAASTDEEFIHAAATSLVFAEADALIRDVQATGPTRLDRSPRVVDMSASDRRDG